MPRRRRTIRFDQIAALPWKTSAALALGGFAGFYWIVPLGMGSDSLALPFHNLARGIAWLILLTIGLASLSAWWKQSRTAAPKRAFEPSPSPRTSDETAADGRSWDAVIQQCARDKAARTTAAEPTLKPTRWSIEVLQRMDWKALEFVSAAYYECRGFRTETTACGADGGIDVTLFRPGAAEPFGIVQCKAWNTRQVGIKPLRELLGVMVHNKVANGVFITSSTYTDEATAFAKTNGIKLGTGDTLLASILTLEPAQQQKLLGIATAGDWTTPSCPSCGTKMVRRESKARDFWGCQNYPRCRQSFPIRRRA
ncbi:MAG: restriction endonuclease [Burkholderiaceae bacterium]